MNLKNILVTLISLLAVCIGGPAVAATTLTMDELPFQPVNGLTFKGVTFHFSISGNPSTDANYHGSNGGLETYVQDPSLEGNSSGLLTLDFTTPASGLQFGVARSVAGTLTPGLQVALFDPSLSPLGTFSLNTSVHVSFSEGLFSSGLTIGRAVLSFPNAASAPRFAIDNLTFTPIPEPATCSLLGIGLLCFAATRFGLKRLG